MSLIYYNVFLHLTPPPPNNQPLMSVNIFSTRNRVPVFNCRIFSESVLDLVGGIEKAIFLFSL